MRPVDLAIRIEWAVIAGIALAAYFGTGGSWLLFALLILVPDLSMAGYLAGPRIGAFCYNALHWAVPPLVLLAAGYQFGPPLLMQVGLIWLAHIAIDRVLGYGLKLPTGFRDTHMGRIGRD